MISSSILEAEPAAAKVRIRTDKLIVDLVDGRTIIIPLQWYPRLAHGSNKERRNWRILGDGDVIEWPELDEHIGIEGLLAGRRSGESRRSLNRWLAGRIRRTPSVRLRT